MARSRRTPGERLIFWLLFLALAIEAAGSGAFDVELVNVTNFTRLRVVHGTDRCPGIEDVRSRSGSPLVDDNVAPIINGSSLLWSGLALERPGHYRVCACLAGENADSTACSSRAAYSYDAGTFAVAGPTGVTVNDGANVPLGAGGSGTDKFFLSLEGARLSTTDKFLAVERSQTCGEFDESLGWRAASSGVFAGSQFLLEGSTDVAFGNLIASDVVLTEEFKLTFSITPGRGSASPQPLDVLIFRHSSADPEVGWGEPPFDMRYFVVQLLQDFSLSVYLDHLDCQSVANCTVTCNLGLVAGTQKDIEVRLTNETLLVSESSNTYPPCSLGGYSRRSSADVEVYATDNYTNFANARLSNIEYRAMTLDGLERDAISDDFDADNAGLWTKSNNNFVDVSQGRVVFSASAYIKSTVVLSRRTQTVVKTSFTKTDTCENHFVTLSTSPTLAKATSLKFGWSCDTKEVTTPTQTVTVACPGRSHYQLTITLEPDGTAIYEDDSNCSTLVIHGGLSGVAGQDIHVFLGAVPPSSASFEGVNVTVTEPFLLPARRGENTQRSLNWTGLSLDAMESGSYRTCWCSQGPVEVLSRELASEPASSTTTRTTTTTPYTVTLTTTATATTTATLSSRRLVGGTAPTISVSAGFFYNLTGRQLIGSGGSEPSSITPWTLGHHVQWASTGASTYTIYAHNHGAEVDDPSNRTLLDSLDENQTGFHLPSTDPLANYDKISVWASNTLVGQSSLTSYQQYLPVPSVTNPGLYDSDLRDGVLGGRVRWRPSGSQSHSGYSVWLSEDENGYKRTYLVDRLNQPCRVPRDRIFLDLPQNGVAVGQARYLIVYACNEAGEMALGSAVGLVDRYAPNPTGCTRFEEFKTEAGAFTVGGSDLQLVNGATGYGRLKAAVGAFLLQLRGGEFLESDRVNVVASRVQCGGPGASLPHESVSLNQVGNFPREKRTLWNVTVNASGTYRLCMCLLAEACDSIAYKGFRQNTFAVTTLSSRIGTPWGGPPLDGIPFDVWVTGSHLDGSDRIQVVNDTVQCGQPGANESALDDPGAVNASGHVSEDSRGDDVLRWSGLNVQAGRGYRVCWCGGLGPGCTTAEAFGTEVGAFYVDLRPTNTTTTTTSTTSTTTTTTTVSTTNTTTTTSTTTTSSTTTISSTTSTTTTVTSTTSSTTTSNTTTSTTMTSTTTTSTTSTATITRTTTTNTTSTTSTTTSSTSTTNTTTTSTTSTTTTSITTITSTITVTFTTFTTTTTTTPPSGRVMTFGMIFDVDFLDLDSLFGLPPEDVFTYEWALLNQQLLAEAIAAVCGLPRYDALVLKVSPAFGGGDPGSGGGDPGSGGGDPGFGGDPGDGGYSFFAFRLDVMLVLPPVNVSELGLPPNATAEQVANATARDDTALSHSLMQKVLGPAWAGGGLNSTTGGWHIIDELKSMITARGGALPGGLDGGHGYTAVPPSVYHDYILPVTTTATTTTTTSSTTTTLQPCLTVPPRPPNAVGSYAHCVPRDHLHECEVTCDRGYRVNGVLQCNEGTFVEVPSPACAIKRCPAPTDYGVPVLLPDGSALVGRSVNRTDLAMLNCSGLVYGSLCETVCKPGYAFDPPTGGRHLVCDEEGNSSINVTFQGNATCVPMGQAESLRCHGRTPTYPGVEPPFGCKGLYHGQTCGLSCKRGYTLENANAIVCNRGNLEPDTGQTPQCSPSSCETPPIVLNGGDHTNCSGLPHGASCAPRCLPGYTMIEGGITCEYGNFRVTGKCVEDFIADIIKTEQAAAASGQPVESLIVVADGAEFDLDIVVSEEQVQNLVENSGVSTTVERFDYYWATGNTGVVLEAIGWILELAPSLIDMELFPLFLRLRRLDADDLEPRGLQALPTANPGNGSFRMRLRFVLPVVQTTTLTTTGSAQVPQAARSAEDEFIEYLLSRFMGPSYVSSGGGASANGTGAGAGSYAPGLFTAIHQQLEARNRTAPAGLLTSAAVSSNAPPVFVQNLALLKPKWVVDVWGACSCDGGPMLQSRSVICTVAHTASCDAVAAKPIDTQPCVCPTPPPPIPWLGIPDETKAAVGGGGLVGLFCLGFCCCELRRFCKNTKTGKKRFADHNNVSASYIVQDPAKKETTDGKVHVVWDVSDEKVRVLLQKTKVQPDEQNPELTRDGDAEDGAQAERVERENTVETALPMGGDAGAETLLQQMLDEAKPMYQDGERVEYFSKTHQCWLPGTVKLSLYQTDTGALAKYDVHIGRGNQWRSDVAIDCMRLPFMQADPVEIFSKRGGGKWVPAAICGVQASAATSLGYRVQLDESVEGFDNLRSSQQNSPTSASPQPRLESSLSNSLMRASGQLLGMQAAAPAAASNAPEVETGGQILQKVPAIRLRRLFPEGCPVEVYRGPPRGWVPAIVASRRGVQLQYPEPLSQFSPGTVDGGKTAAARRQSAAAASSCSSAAPAQTQTQVLMRPWVMVPIQEDSPTDLFDDEGPVDMVASYLLRLRTLYVVSGHGTQDRLLLL